MLTNPKSPLFIIVCHTLLLKSLFLHFGLNPLPHPLIYNFLIPTGSLNLNLFLQHERIQKDSLRYVIIKYFNRHLKNNEYVIERRIDKVLKVLKEKLHS